MVIYYFVSKNKKTVPRRFFYQPCHTPVTKHMRIMRRRRILFIIKQHIPLCESSIFARKSIFRPAGKHKKDRFCKQERSTCIHLIRLPLSHKQSSYLSTAPLSLAGQASAYIENFAGLEQTADRFIQRRDRLASHQLALYTKYCFVVINYTRSQ